MSELSTAATIVVWGFSIIAATSIGGRRCTRIDGFLLGLFLGPLGVIATCVFPQSPRLAASWRYDMECEYRRITQRYTDAASDVQVRCPTCNMQFAARPTERATICPTCGERVRVHAPAVEA